MSWKKKVFHLPCWLVVCFFYFTASHVQAQPPNDQCIDAISINCGSYIEGNTFGADFDDVEFCGTSVTNPDVWYEFLGNGNNVIISLCDSTGSDTQLFVFSNNCSFLNCVTGNDDFCDLQSQVDFLTLPGVTYFILVGSSSETFTLELSCVTPPPTIICPLNVTVDCNASTDPSATGIATAIQHCGTISPSITFIDQPDFIDCGGYTGSIIRNWVATDSCGNTSECFQIIDVIDVISPVIECPPDVTIGCGDSSDPAFTGFAGVADNCDSSVTLSHEDFTIGGSNTITREWTGTDACGNNSTCVQTIEIADADPVFLDADLYSCGFNISCNGSSDGSITASVPGGTPAFDYIWSNGETTSSISGLTAGDYSVTVVDATGCTFTGSITLTEPPPLIVNITGAGVTSNGESNGEASVIVSGGCDPYSIVWDDGQTTFTRSDLEGGGYSATITDANGCTIIETISITEPPVEITANPIATCATCDCCEDCEDATQNVTSPAYVTASCDLTVNTFTGNLTVDPALISIPSLGPDLEIEFFYNSSKAGVDYGFGGGWTYNYNIVYESVPDGIIIHRGDGREDFFSLIAGTYVPEPGVFDTLTEYMSGKFRLRDKLGKICWFDDPVHKKVTRIEDRNGNTLGLSYSEGNIESLTDASGRQLSIIWNGGYLEKVIDPNLIPPREVLFHYDERCMPDEITDPLGNISKYEYDDEKKLTKLTDRRGTVYEIQYNSDRAVSYVGMALMSDNFVYDTLQSETRVFRTAGTSSSETIYEFDVTGSVIGVRNPCCAPGQEEHFTYDADLNQTSLTDGNGNTWIYTYDARGNRITESDPLGNSMTMVYDSIFNQLISKTDKNGHTTTFSYDAQGSLLQKNMPLGISESFTYDSFGNMTSFTDGNGNTTTFIYDSQGNLISVQHPIGTENFSYDNAGRRITETDENGNVSTFSYDGLNRVIEVKNALNQGILMTYDPLGNLLSSTDALGRTNTFSYDALNRMTNQTTPAGSTIFEYDVVGMTQMITDPNGNVSSTVHSSIVNNVADFPAVETDAMGNTAWAGYDNNGNLSKQSDFMHQVTRYTYDALNRRLSTKDRIGNLTQWTYDPEGNRLSETDARGNTKTYLYDDLDRLIQINYPIGTVTFTYDANGNRLSETDPNGNTVTFSYDANDRLVALTDPLGATTTFTYDEKGNLLSKTDRNGNTSTWTYDVLNRVSTQLNPLSETTTFSYDAVGNIQSVGTPNGNTINYNYDDADRLIQATDLLGTIVSNTFDPNSNMLTEVDGNGNSSQYSYDGLNRLIQTTDPIGNGTQKTYDNNGNQLTETDRNGNATSYVYDALNRRIGITNTLGNTSATKYDPVGNVVSLTDANGNTTSYMYDANDRQILEKFPDGSMKEYTYDLQGNLTGRIDNNGDQTLFTYDPLNRLISRDYPSGMSDETFTYDLEGRILTATNSNAALSYDYDNANRVISETLNGESTQYFYDISGRKRNLTYPGGRTIEEEGTLRNRLLRINEGVLVLDQRLFDPGHRLESRNYSNGTSTTYGYNPNDWMTDIVHLNTGGTFSGFQYLFDNEGHRLSSENLQRPSHSEQYSYNSIYELSNFKVGTIVSGSIPSPLTENIYNYDPVGNRTSISENAAITSYVSNNLNEYTSIVNGGAVLPDYDLNGNMLFDGNHFYAYDFENRLISVDGGSTASYKYDALGRRVQKIAGGATTNYYYDDGRVIEERDAADITTATYVYGEWVDEILNMQRGGQDYFYHANSLGSIVAVSNIAGNVVERYEYDAYGKPYFYDSSYVSLSSSAIGSPYLFTGREYDSEADNYYYRARYFNHTLGRFQQRDIISIKDMAFCSSLPYSDDPLECPVYTKAIRNVFEYASGDPINRLDPSGAIDWSTAEKIRDNVRPWGVGPNGANYRVKTDAGNWVVIWKPYDGTTYWCHGLTVGGNTVADGPFSPYSGASIARILADEYKQICCNSAKPGDIAAFTNTSTGMVDHSAVFTNVVQSGGNIDEGNSKLNSKNGQRPLDNQSITELKAIYPGRTYKCYRKK